MPPRLPSRLHAGLSLLALLLAACGSAVAVADPMPEPTSPPATAPSIINSPTPLPTAVPATTTAVPATPLPPTVAASPTIAPTVSPTPPNPPPEITLLFTGDINPGRCVYAQAKAAEDMALPYRALAPLLQKADILIGSLDGTLSDYNPPAPCDEAYRNLMAPSEAVEGLAFAGFDVMGVATNHMKDCGLIRGCVNDSLFDTLDILAANGILPAGAGADLEAATSPAIVTMHGVRFAFIGIGAINRQIWAAMASPGIAPFQTDIFLDAIARARAQADVVIVLPHWGREYSPLITYEQRQAAHRMVAAGATLVVGNHPHRVQGVETLPNGAVVAYALGNFVFDQEWSDGTQYTIQGILLQARFHGADLVEVDLLPIHIYDDIQPRLADEVEAARILADVAASMESAPPP